MHLECAYPTISRWICWNIVDNMKSRMPYSSYLNRMVMAEVFIDIVRINSKEGFSFRVPEALFLNRKIITDRVDIVSEKFFSSERVYIVGGENKYDLQTFLEKDIGPLSKDVLKFYDSTLWWTENDPYMQ